MEIYNKKPPKDGFLILNISLLNNNIKDKTSDYKQQPEQKGFI